MSRASRYRNPNNLHVVPISSVLNNKPIQLQRRPVMQNVFPPVVPVVPVPLLPTPSPAFPVANDLQGGFNKKRRKRARKRDRKRSANKNVLKNSSALPDPSGYRWFNPNNINKNNVDASVNKEAETEKVEVTEAEVTKAEVTEAEVTEAKVTEAEVTEAEATEAEVTEAPPAEEHFEEVEVASTEGDGKRIPVGFRRTKLHYLSYKKKSFFRPKYYDFSSQRIVVNCLNVADDVSVDVDVDVVSEAEYDGYETDTYDPNEKFGKIIEIEDDENTEEEQNLDDDTEMEEDSTHIVTDETEESNQAISNTADEESTPADTDKLDKHSVSAAVNESDDESSCIIVDEIKEKNIDVVTIKESIPDKKKIVSLKKWINNVCIEDKNDLMQAKSLIQDKLEAWESHLIGLEYLIEILDNNKVTALKYFCVLCDEEMDVTEIPESYVINHVSGCNHITKYLGS